MPVMATSTFYVTLIGSMLLIGCMAFLTFKLSGVTRDAPKGGGRRHFKSDPNESFRKMPDDLRESINRRSDDLRESLRQKSGHPDTEPT